MKIKTSVGRTFLSANPQCSRETCVFEYCHSEPYAAAGEDA